MKGSRGYERDNNLSFNLIEKSAAQGNPRGLMMTGYYHEFGIGTEVNSVRAFQIYSDFNPIMDDEMFCLTGLARYYQEGRVTEKSESKSKFFTEKADILQKIKCLESKSGFPIGFESEHDHLTLEFQRGFDV